MTGHRVYWSRVSFASVVSKVKRIRPSSEDPETIAAT